MVSNLMEGLRPLNAAELKAMDAFTKEMSEVVIPRLVEERLEREEIAEASRRRILHGCI